MNVLIGDPSTFLNSSFILLMLKKHRMRAKSLHSMKGCLTYYILWLFLIFEYKGVHKFFFYLFIIAKSLMIQNIGLSAKFC